MKRVTTFTSSKNSLLAICLLLPIFALNALAERDRASITDVRVSTTTPSGGERIVVTATIENTGSNTWEPVGETTKAEVGKYYFDLYIYDSEGVRSDIAEAIIPLPRSISPGEKIDIKAEIIAPPRSGTHFLCLSILNNGRHRFSSKILNSSQDHIQTGPTVRLRM
jgi:hypothetical protein